MGPTFSLVALLGIPLFWQQLKALYGRIRQRSIGVWQALRMPMAVLVPAVDFDALQQVVVIRSYDGSA